jgi:hypothetical protein
VRSIGQTPRLLEKKLTVSRHLDDPEKWVSFAIASIDPDSEGFTRRHYSDRWSLTRLRQSLALSDLGEVFS